MAQAQSAHPATPPRLRWIEAAPVSPLLVGAGFAALLLASYFGYEWAAGELGDVLAGTAYGVRVP